MINPWFWNPISSSLFYNLGHLLSPNLMFSIRLFVGHSFFNATSQGKAGLCHLLWLAEYEAPRLSETQVILKGCFILPDPRNQWVFKKRSWARPNRWHSLLKEVLYRYSKIGRSPKGRKERIVFQTTIGFRGYIRVLPTVYSNARISRGWFFGWKMSNFRGVFSNNLVKLERPHPKGRFLEGMFPGLAISGNSRLVNYHILAGLMGATSCSCISGLIGLRKKAFEISAVETTSCDQWNMTFRLVKRYPHWN